MALYVVTDYWVNGYTEGDSEQVQAGGGGLAHWFWPRRRRYYDDDDGPPEEDVSPKPVEPVGTMDGPSRGRVVVPRQSAPYRPIRVLELDPFTESLIRRVENARQRRREIDADDDDVLMLVL